jgi:hypothetical protein
MFLKGDCVISGGEHFHLGEHRNNLNNILAGKIDKCTLSPTFPVFWTRCFPLQHVQLLLSLRFFVTYISCYHRGLFSLVCYVRLFLGLKIVLLCF